MTKRGLERRVEYWRRRLCPEWRVAVMDRPPDPPPERPDWIACVESDLTLGEIRVFTKPALLRQEPWHIDRVIVHELIHPLLDRVLDHDEVLEGFCPPPAWECYREARRPDMEEFTNRLAHLIADAGHGRASYGTRTVEAKIGDDYSVADLDHP